MSLLMSPTDSVAEAILDTVGVRDETIVLMEVGVERDRLSVAGGIRA